MRERLRLVDISDREFLLLVPEAADDDGWTQSLRLADVLDMGENGNRHVSTRFSWMTRLGATEREVERDDAGHIRVRRNGQPFYTQRWQLTDLGEQIAFGRLKAAAERQLTKLTAGELIIVAQQLGSSSLGDDNAAKMIGRAWRYSSAKERMG